MRTVCILSIILITLLIANYWSGSVLARTAQKLGNELDSVASYVETGDWGGALGSLDRFESEWGNIKGIWAVLIEHREMDSIEDGFKKMRAYLESQDRALALGEAEMVKRLLEHIPEKHSFALENVL